MGLQHGQGMVAIWGDMEFLLAIGVLVAVCLMQRAWARNSESGRSRSVTGGILKAP
jgi:hypothetical protein